jgi:hypothetical protein
MLKKFLVSAFLLAAGPALAQSVQYVSPVTRNHVPVWNTNGVIADGGSSADSPITSIGVTNNGGQGICVNSARSTAAGYNSLCFGVGTSGPATISLQNTGSASAQVLNFVINGTTYPFPGALASITINSTPVLGGTNGECLEISSSVVSQVPCSILSAGTTGTGAVVLQNSPTLAGTIGGNLTFNGNESFVGNVTMGSQFIVNGVSTPASAANQTVVQGNISPITLANTGQAWLFGQSVGGATIQGDGSSFDFSLLNKAGTVVMEVPTGASGVTFPVALTFSGLSSGTCASSVLINASNQVITGSCPGAASSIQVGSTSVTSGTNGYLLYNNSGTLGNNTITSFLTGGTGISITGTTTATIATNLIGGTGISITGSAPESIALSTITGPGVLGASASGAGQSIATVSTPILLNTLTASGSSSLQDVTSLTSAFTAYELVFENIIPATNNTTLELQAHSGGTYQTSGYVASTFSNAGSTTVGNSVPTTFIQISVASQLNNTSPGLSGRIRVYTPSVSAIHIWNGEFAHADAATIANVITSGYWNSSAVIDGFQVLAASGNLTSGVIKVYGIP